MFCKNWIDLADFTASINVANFFFANFHEQSDYSLAYKLKSYVCLVFIDFAIVQ